MKTSRGGIQGERRAGGADVTPKTSAWDMCAWLSGRSQMLVDRLSIRTRHSLSRAMRSRSPGLLKRHCQPHTTKGPVHAAFELLVLYPGVPPTSSMHPASSWLNLSLFPLCSAALAMAKERRRNHPAGLLSSISAAHESPAREKYLASMVIGLAQWVRDHDSSLRYSVLVSPAIRRPFLIATVLYMFCVPRSGPWAGAAIPEQASACRLSPCSGFLLVFLLAGLSFPSRTSL